MKSLREYLWFNTKTRRAYINITPKVEELVKKSYDHNNGEDNADAHLKRTIMGREVIVAITDGKLDFGPWEQIFYGEFDGQRRKRVMVKMIGE